MDGNSWRPAQGDPGMASSDWRSELSAESRQRIVNKIMETLKKHLPISGPEGVAELNKIAVRFEEKIYTAATSQPDYLRKISLKMLTMESKSTNANPLASNSAVGNQNPQDPAVNSMQQVRNQGQPLPLASQSQARQQILAQNLQNSVASGAVPNTSNLPPTLSSMSVVSQAGLSSVVSQSSSVQSISGLSQNAVSNSIGQSIPPNMYSNSQRQLQARQLSQQVAPQQQQQPQGQQHLLYQQHLQHQLMKQKLQQGNMQPSLLQQSHIQQQQSLLQPNQLQPSQQSHMQTSQQPSLQPSQSAIQQQTSQMQAVQQSSLQQNQQSSLQQSVPSVLQQHQHSVLRQQQQQQQQQQQLQQSVVQSQPSMTNQQQPQINQAPMMSSQQQQQLMSQQTNSSGIQQNQILGQQNIVPDIQQQQQQRLLAQQNLSSMHQQQQMLGPQSSMPSMHQQPQQLSQQSSLSGMQQSQPLLSQQSNVSSLQQHSHSIHQLLQAKSSVQHQQSQQASSLLMQQQSQQPHSQPSHQQLMPQIQSQAAQQQMVLQASSLQRELQQRIQTGGMLQPQSAVEQQKPSFQPQRGLAETSSPSIESTAQSAHPAAGDWQEEIYQKLKSLKDMYYNELDELCRKLTIKCQQQESLVQTQAQSDQLDKLRSYRNALRSSLCYLIMPKSNIPLSLKDRMEMFEKQLQQFLNLSKNRKVPPPHQQAQQLQPQSVGQSFSVQQQQSQTQISQVQQHESHTNQLQSVNVQNPVTTMQTSSVTSIQHGAVPLGQHVGVPTSHNLRNVMQPASNLDSPQTNNLGSLQQGAMTSLAQGVGTMQPTIISAPQQTTVSSLAQSGLNTLQQSSVNTIQSNASMLQHQQQLKQLQQRQLQQHLIQQQHKQQMMQQPQLAPQYLQQQFPLHQKQQQAAQLQAHQMPQLHQLSDMKPGVGIKPGLFQPHNSIGQRPVHQQLKSGSSFPVSSPQLATSPQILQHSSPQIDQQSLLGAAAVPKIGTPLQPASSPFIVPSPSTPVTPSPLPGDSEKPGASPLSKTGSIVSQQSTVPVAQAQSLAIGTPGISASPLLAEFTIPDGNQGNAAVLGSSSKSSTSERPFDRLIKAVSSVSSKAFASSISDISSAVNLVDRLACSAPGNCSKASVGEDLAATTRCRLQARNLISQDGNAAAKKMKRNMTAMPLNTMSSAGSVNNSVQQPASLESSELESTATSRIKRPRIEVNPILLEEIKEINQKMIDTVVDISDEDNDLTAAATEGRDGIVIKCSYNAVALCPSMKSQYALAEVSPILPLRLLVPSNYPSCSPVFLDMLPIETGKEGEDLSAKAKSMFSLSARSLSHPMSLGDIARTWDVCARKVMTEYAHQSGGGSFSSSYGTWESCVSA